MTSRQDDKREFVRVPFNTEVEISTGGWLVRSDHGIDVSMNGIRLSSIDPASGPHPLPGTPCKATIHLHASDSGFVIEADGTIIRSEPGCMAVEFEDIDLDSYERLRQLILSNSDDVEIAEHQFEEHQGIRRKA